MCSVVTHGDFGAMSNDDTKEDGYYIVKFNYNAYNIQEDIIIDGRIISMVEQVANYFYLSHLKQGYKWYEYPLYDTSQNVVIEKNIGSSKIRHWYWSFSKIPTQICNWKVER